MARIDAGGLGLRALAGVMGAGETRRRLSILIYHRVLTGDDRLNTWDPTAAQFESQMQVLSRCFVPTRLDDAVARLQHGKLPPNAVAVTFDDGYADNVDTALPILRRNRVPATFFIATGYLHGANMWNDRIVESVRYCEASELDSGDAILGRLPVASVEQRRVAISRLLEALKHLPPAEREARTAEIEARAGGREAEPLMMDESGVRTLRRAGMEIGAHTVTHPILTRLSEREACREIVASRDDLEAILGEPVKSFAYPNGRPGRDYGAEHVRLVEEAGFAAAVSTAAGAAGSSADIYQLPRFTPWQRDPLRFGLSLLANRRNVRPAIVARAETGQPGR